ncbi:YfiH family protein [Nakamurella flavida]|nr:peptidoglycan editing factor PgeF [Nakamurella flavida]MDP9777453.1 YfiH family protein [Nakamurella flavida]
MLTTRAGGVSRPPYDSFNLGAAVGDDPAAVVANRSRLAEVSGVGRGNLVFMDQVHGTRVRGVDRPTPPNTSVTATDGLVTTTVGLGLAVLVADCVPVLAGDPVAAVIGVAHAGRKGAAAGIGRELLEQMVAAGAEVGRVEVLLGPAVCGSCYEVPAAMRDEVEAALPGSATTSTRGTPALDLRAGMSAQLRSAGVAGVRTDPRCTVTDPALFSHRRATAERPPRPTGRLAGLIWMER